jgi:hypothetical protein
MAEVVHEKLPLHGAALSAVQLLAALIAVANDRSSSLSRALQRALTSPTLVALHAALFIFVHTATNIALHGLDSDGTGRVVLVSFLVAPLIWLVVGLLTMTLVATTHGLACLWAAALRRWLTATPTRPFPRSSPSRAIIGRYAARIGCAVWLTSACVLHPFLLYASATISTPLDPSYMHYVIHCRCSITPVLDCSTNFVSY